MTARDSLPLHALAENDLAAANPDLLRTMVKTFADALMSAEADALCNAGYGQISDEHVNHRKGYHPCERDTRVGSFLAMLKAKVHRKLDSGPRRHRTAPRVLKHPDSKYSPSVKKRQHCPALRVPALVTALKPAMFH